MKLKLRSGFRIKESSVSIVLSDIEFRAQCNSEVPEVLERVFADAQSNSKDLIINLVNPSNGDEAKQILEAVEPQKLKLKDLVH
jgi:hypothetical protein